MTTSIIDDLGAYSYMKWLTRRNYSRTFAKRRPHSWWVNKTESWTVLLPRTQRNVKAVMECQLRGHLESMEWQSRVNNWLESGNIPQRARQLTHGTRDVSLFLAVECDLVSRDGRLCQYWADTTALVTACRASSLTEPPLPGFTLTFNDSPKSSFGF